MASRALLELRAAPCNIDASLYPNDSQLEQVVLAAEKAMTAQAGTATTKAPSAQAIASAT